MRVWIAMAILAAGILAAQAISPAEQEIIFGGNSSASNPPQPTGKILLADGVSHLLLADGVSRLCRAGGC